MLGIGLSPEGIALAHVVRSGAEAPRLLHCEFQPLGPEDNAVTILRQRVQQLGLCNVPVVTALNPGEFSLQMVEAPKVAPEELGQAVRWSIRDRLDFDIDEAVIEVFEIPGQKERGRAPLVYVVAARQQVVQRYIDQFTDAGVSLEYIDIPELAQRNIAALLPEDASGVAVLSLTDTVGELTLTREGVLYLARELEQDKQLLQQAEPVVQGGGGAGLALAGMPPERQRLLDGIVLEVQRSLDYYESHFSQPPITSLVIAPQYQVLSDVCEYLAGMLGMPVRFLDLNDVLEVAEPLNATLQADCYLAIGLALREIEEEG